MKPCANFVQEQQTLLSALWGKLQDSPQRVSCLQTTNAQSVLLSRGLQAYCDHAAALAERALSAAYPVLTQLLGQENFGPLARHFWRLQPPVCGDIALWGDSLAVFLEAAPQLVDEPFLGDIARVEWALHRVATAKDALLDVSSFELLFSNPDLATLRLSAGVAVLASSYPVVSLINAHLQAKPDLQQAGAMLRGGVAEHALVWRQGFKPRVRHSSAAEQALVLALQAGHTLERALSCADQAGAGDTLLLDFNAWLVQSVQTGLVTGAYLLPHHPQENLS